MNDSTEQSNSRVVSISEMIDLGTQRATMYGLLARFFRVEVNKAFLDTLKEKEFPADTGNEKFDDGCRRIVMYLNGCKENALSELAVDYVKAFIGHGMDAYAAAYPYESVYTSPKRLLMQDARDKVLAIYRSAGLDKTDSWKESEDHLALELEYIQVLCNRANIALRGGKEKEFYQVLKNQKDFLETHLTLWVPYFVNDVQKFAKTDFYRGASLLLEGFMVSDLEFICNVLEEAEVGTSVQCA